MNQLELFEACEKGKLLAASLEVIERLAKNPLADQDGNTDEIEGVSELKDLILDARKIVEADWFKLLKAIR